MTITIPYLTDTAYAGIELHYTIKSMRKYMPGATIFTIGGVSKWADGNIPCAFHGDRKQQNIVRKIEAACNASAVPDDFIVCSDDVFLLEPMPEVKAWHGGSLAKAIRYGQYAGYFKNALDIGAVNNFDIHAPWVCNKQKFMTDVTPLFTGKKDYLIQSVYFRGTEGEYMEDMKINYYQSADTILKKISGHRRFSSGPSGVTNQLRKVWRELYDTE